VRSRSSRVGSLVALAVLSTVAVLVVIEVAARMWPRPTSDLSGLHVLRPDRPWLFGLRPGGRQPIQDLEAEYVINADGFRGPPLVRPKPEGTFRIVVVGDSLTFGWSVREEDTLARQLESRLRSWSPDARIEVLNLGVSGYNPYTEAKWLAEMAPVVDPDLVLVQFCINDLNDPTLHFDYATRAPMAFPDEALPDPARRPPPPSLPARLCSLSRACALLRKQLPSRADQVRALEAVAPHGDPTPAELAWIRQSYSEMARTAREQGAEFAVIVFPYSTQLEPSSATTLQDDLRELGRDRDWTIVDLLPSYREARATAATDALFIDLWHPTAEGFRVAGDALAAGLACANLLPVQAPAGVCAELRGSR
jgi:lysophospholipase L1-like esterase